MSHESPPLTEADLTRHADHLAMIAGKVPPPPDGPAPFRTSANMAQLLDQNGTAAAMLAVPGMDAECPKCNGVGYTLEHSTIPSDHYPDGDCKGNCPQQVQCDCQAEAPMPTTELQRDAIARGEMEQDARRYRRLQILGVAVCGSKNLDQGTVSRFSNLDAVVDEDLAAYPSRGEARLIVPREMEARAVAMEARCEKLEEALREIVPILGKTHYRGTLAMVRALLNAPTESTNESP